MIEKVPDFNHAIALWKADQPVAARDELRRVVASQPTHEKAWLWLARLSDGSYEQWQALHQVLMINPENPVAQKAMAQRFPPKVQERYRHVQDLLAEAVFAETWAGSEAIYLRVLELDPTNQEALETVMDGYRTHQQWERGLQVVQILRERQPDNPDLVRRQIDLALALDNQTIYMEMSDLLMTHPAVQVDDLLTIARNFANQRRYDVVTRLLERAATLDPSNQTVLYGLSRAYEAVDQPAQAQRVMQMIVDLDRTSSAGQDVMARLLEEAPYVPLAMRQNTLVALREVLGIVLPLALLGWLDHYDAFPFVVPLFGIVVATIGGYLLVTATSSHEQIILRPLFPDGVDMLSRQGMGVAGAILLLLAVYLTMQTSTTHLADYADYRQASCAEMVDFIYSIPELQADLHYFEDLRQRRPTYYAQDQCAFLDDMLFMMGYE